MIDASNAHSYPDRNQWDLGEGKGQRAKEQRKWGTYSNTGRDKIALVEYENKMLVGSLLFHVLLNRSTAGTKWVSSVKDV